MSEPSAPEAAGVPWSAAPPARRSARGMLLLTASSGLYIASGYAITVWLARELGPRDFGRYGVVTAIVTLISIVVGRGVPVAAGRAIAAEPAAAQRTIAVATRVMMPLVLAVAAVAAAATLPVAAALGDDALRVPLLVGAAAALTYGLQAVPLAWFTGLQQHGRQALAQVAYAVSRLVTIIVGAVLGGLTGAIAGFVAAPGVAAVATIAGLGPRPRELLAGGTDGSPAREPTTAGAAILRSSVPLVGVAALASVLLTIDLLAFKRVGEAADVGRYAAAAAVAHVPFFLLRSAPIVLMPAVAAARAAANGEEADTDRRIREEVRSGVGDAIALLALPTALLVAVGDRAVELVFGARYALEDPVVAPLALATAAIAFYTVFVGIETALGSLRVALGTGLLGSALVAAAAAIGGQGSNLSRAAWFVAIAAGATVILHGWFVWARIGPYVPARALGAVAVAAAVAAPALALPSSGGWLVTSVAAASAAYAAIVLATGVVRLR